MSYDTLRPLNYGDIPTVMKIIGMQAADGLSDTRREELIEAAADRRANYESSKLDRAARQQEQRAVRMSRKHLRGNRRAAKAMMRATALREAAVARKQ